MKVALYPGSFDPITNGHLDILQRALAVFDKVIVAVLENPRKTPLLDAPTRVAIIREVVADAGLPAERVEVTTFDGLTVNAVHANGAGSIVRGLRAISDFEAELQLAHNNRRLAPDLDTVFFMTAVEHGYVSSSLVKEIAGFGGDVSSMVPPAAGRAIAEALKAG
jgi:pantetheine-phosphate adenylyltransferase